MLPLGIPSFTPIDLSLDCPSNLKEAIDWILRVTGKDGGGGDNGAITALTKEVQNLLQGVEESESKLSAEFTKVKQALNTDSGSSLITKLAEGLQQFVGYKSNDNNGLITGAGIAPSNIATHRLCDATIAFTIGVLEGCKGHSAVKSNGNLNKVNTLIKKLYECYGKGAAGLEGVAQEVESQLANSGKQWPYLDGFVNDFRDSFTKNLRSGLPTDAKALAGKVGAYLKGVFEGTKGGWGSATDVDGKLTTLLTAAKGKNSQDTYDPNAENVSNNIGEVQNAITPVHPAVKPILTAGRNAFMNALKMPNYTLSASFQTCAKIFLGCLPLYYQALTYIYWGCHEKGGGWNAMTLDGRPLKDFLYSMWYDPSKVQVVKRGSDRVSVLDEKFADFSQKLTSSNKSYPQFLQALQENATQKLTRSSTDNCPLSALYYCASRYFTCKQAQIAVPTKSPSTIREMLYFLAALPFTPEYGDLEKHIDSLLPRSIPISIGGIDHSKNPIILSSANIKGNLPTTSLFATRILGLLQGPGNSKNKKSDPWLHELFSNTDFQFKYSAGSALFNALSNYTYALQFQLYFLYKQCSGKYTEACGWRDCRYGKEIEGSGTSSLKSHICPGFKCQNATSCTHNSGQCNHNKYTESGGCGKSASTPSPLQAFITGALPSFGLSSSSTPNHMSDHPQGALCHVPMGFQANHLRSVGNGGALYNVLKPICGDVSSPLRQLCEKLGCLTKRTPRSLGDFFGFMWHLNGQLYNKRSSDPAMQRWVNKLANLTPFSSTVKDHINVLQTFVGTGHDSHTDSRTDLSSLHLSIQQNHSACYGTGKTCGPYLYPFTVSNGATFGMPAPYASVYLSWIVYLTDDLETGFQELLDEFKYIDCTKTGCRKSTIGQTKCEQSHLPGTHGNSNECKCDSVVHCGGVLPLLYRYGFTFGSVSQLSGNNKRTCENFHSQLQSVINGQPLRDLFESIYYFLFLFRYYFLCNLSGFWSIYIGLILYTFFFLLDTLQLRSRLKLTSSHVVPPLALLTSGKPLPITKLTYIGQ
ncbi:variant erythrocyte surface antigen-1 family protein [Babesia caballi]|uniref:Variant erythrocyte surface antigen-1 family protein n=1 Tax=Babesia caballi TaxID=5871 RepID=A0AAV4LY30_BABCB|nr:variant erythrocyte surface antigen-1 family protein [Babesia caballi]